jgi:NAD(P)-dependent dehydrogenase (short-subunit alcohol dehydrogenase family)
MTTWFITGCSTGLGHSLASGVLEAGFNAVVTARDPASVAELVARYPDTAIATALDVTDMQAVTRAIQLAEDRFGGIDVLVNNAGYGYRAAVEEADEREVEALFATNFHGPFSVIKAALPAMRARGSGMIINVSSIAARLAMPGSGFYSATKFALEGMSDALRRELEPLGIRVLIVEPGAFRTDFARRSLRGATDGIDAYDPTAGARRKGIDKTHGSQPGDPDRAARAIIDMIAKETLPVRLLLGSDAVAIVGEEIDRQREEIRTWRDISVTTDFRDER